MAVVLQHYVNVFDGVSQFSARPAVIEFTDTNTFTLAKIEPATGVRTEVIFDNVPASEVTLGGTQATPWFSYNGVKRRVDFSFGSRVAGSFGLVGMAVQSSMISKSGVGEWIAAFRAAGAPVKYWSQGKTMGIGFAIGGGIVVLVIIIVVAVALTSSY